MDVTRRFKLMKRATFHWNDLDRPVDVLAQIESHWNISITNKESIPHDLWAGGAAVDVDASEALLLVLGQFDLTVQWDSNGTDVTAIPAEHHPVVEQIHRTLEMTPEDALASIHKAFPGITATIVRKQIVAQAGVVEHDKNRLSHRRTEPATRTSRGRPSATRPSHFSGHHCAHTIDGNSDGPRRTGYRRRVRCDGHRKGRYLTRHPDHH